MHSTRACSALQVTAANTRVASPQQVVTLSSCSCASCRCIDAKVSSTSCSFSCTWCKHSVVSGLIWCFSMTCYYWMVALVSTLPAIPAAGPVKDAMHVPATAEAQVGLLP